MKNVKKLISYIKINNIWIISIVLIIALLILFLLNRQYSVQRPVATNIFSDFSNVVATLISAITILYLYKTYLETVKQNSRIAIENSFQLIDTQITNFSFKEKKGIEAISSLSIEAGIDNSQYYNQLTLILSLFENHKSLIDDSFAFDKAEKDSFLKLTWFLFYSKILWIIYFKIENKADLFNPKNGERVFHDDFGVTIPRYCVLALESLDFLGNKGLIIIDNNFKRDVINRLNEIKKMLSSN